MAIHYRYSCPPEADLATIPTPYCRDNRPFRCHRDSLGPLIHLCEAAKRDGVGIVVISAFRDIAYQTELYADARRRHGFDGASTWVAPPGHSEHHTGYALDLADRDHPETDDEPGFETTPAAYWLLRHAPHHGFELSFPKGNPQGVGYEPWHWRFCATPAAKKLFDSLR